MTRVASTESISAKCLWIEAGQPHESDGATGLEGMLGMSPLDLQKEAEILTDTH